FRGKGPILSKTEFEIIEAVGKGLIRAGIMPPMKIHDSIRAGTPVDPGERMFLFGLVDFLRAWDRVRGEVSSVSASIGDAKNAALPFLRLFSVDLAVRVSAYLLLAGVNLDPDQDVPWASESGRGWLLTRWIERAGDRAPSKTELASKLTGFVDGKDGASHQTIGYWLDGTNQPTVEHQNELAAFFSRVIEGASEIDLRSEMRRFYGLWSLCERLAGVVGWDVVEDVARRVCRYIATGQSWIRESGDPTNPEVQQTLLSNLWKGLWRPGLGHGNASLTGFMERGKVWRGPWTKLETDPVWRTDLLVCGATAKMFSGHEGAPGSYAIERQWQPFARRIQHCYQRSAGIEKFLKAYPELKSASLPPPFDRDGINKLMWSYHRLWPEELAQGWTTLSTLNAELAGAHFEQLASDEEVWGFFEDAEAYWQLAVQATPQYAYRAFRLGALYGEMGEINKARNWLTRATELDPEWPQPQLEIARALMHVGRYQEAFDYLRSMPSAMVKDHVFGTYLLGHAALAIGKVGTASDAFSRLVKLQPDNAGAYAGASLALFETYQKDPGSPAAKEARKTGKRLAKEAALRGDPSAAQEWGIS
ncbi:MAG: hypothetical protein KDB68_17290, partial [Planctomycetes bacterium]|nr:hypothetical protein [Planctomycetota bacterium]